MKAFLLDTPPMGAVGQMAMDEAVLDHAGSDSHILRLYRWSGAAPHGATFGYGQSFSEAQAAVDSRFGSRPVPVVRRCTGGGVVFHDGDITFSFVFPWAKMTAPAMIYREIHMGVHLGLKSCGIASRLWGAPGEDLPPERRGECFAGPEPKDLVHENGVKFLGGALRRRRGLGLYQGSLRPEGFAAPSNMLRAALEEGFRLQWRLLFRKVPPGAAVEAAARRIHDRRYSRKAWNQKR